MARIILYPALALVSTIIPNPDNTAQGGAFSPHNPVVFAKPFPVQDQQFFTSFEPEGTITSITPQGFFGQQLDVKFAKPFPASAQQYQTQVPPRQVPSPVTPHGWEGRQLEYRFAKPFPVSSQQYISVGQTRTIPTPATPYGWWGVQWEFRLAKPFPVTAQVFSVWDLYGDVPPFLPPGAGKRYKHPTNYLPEPASEAKPNKPFRPVWDKAKQGAVETPKPAAGPPPLPPAELFGTPGQAGDAKVNANPTLTLPSFAEYAPNDPLGLSKRMGEVQDKNDAIAVLKKLGLIRGS